MKTNVISVAIVSALLAAAPAAAADGDYGTTGILEVGGSFAIVSQSEDPEGGTTTDLTGIDLSPTIGYFVSDGLQIIGQLPVQNFRVDGGGDKASVTNIGVGVGAAYLFQAANAHVGPQFVARYFMSTIDVSGTFDAKIEDSGPGANVALVAKVPVGGGGVLGASLFMDYMQVSRDIEFAGISGSDDGTVTSLGTAVTFSVFF